MSVPTQNFGPCDCEDCDGNATNCTPCADGGDYATVGTLTDANGTHTLTFQQWVGSPGDEDRWVCCYTSGGIGIAYILYCTDTGSPDHLPAMRLLRIWYIVSYSDDPTCTPAPAVCAPYRYGQLRADNAPPVFYEGPMVSYSAEVPVSSSADDPLSLTFDATDVNSVDGGTLDVEMTYGCVPPVTGDVTISIAKEVDGCVVTELCGPCDIPGVDLTLTTVTDGGSNPGSTMAYTTGPTIWTSDCLSLGTTRTRCTIDCNEGNTRFSAKVSASTSVCDTTPTTYSITYGTTSTSFVRGEWESITTQNWDGVTAPSVAITGWNVNSGIVTSTTNDVSSPNSLALETGAASTTWYATYTTADGHGGDVRASSRFTLTEDGRDSAFSLTLRASSSTPSTGSGTYYGCEVKDVDFSSSGWTVKLYKRVSGTRTDLATVSSTETIAGIGCKLIFSVVSTRLCCEVIRQSDGKYLNSSGVFATGRVACATTTDTSISGAGYAGVSFFQQSTITSPTYSDNYTLDGIEDNSSCDPYLVDYVVIPGTTLWGYGYDSFSVAE